VEGSDIAFLPRCNAKGNFRADTPAGDLSRKWGQFSLSNGIRRDKYESRSYLIASHHAVFRLTLAECRKKLANAAPQTCRAPFVLHILLSLAARAWPGGFGARQVWRDDCPDLTMRPHSLARYLPTEYTTKGGIVRCWSRPEVCAAYVTVTGKREGVG
jgi:hypothetical protein